MFMHTHRGAALHWQAVSGVEQLGGIPKGKCQAASPRVAAGQAEVRPYLGYWGSCVGQAKGRGLQVGGALPQMPGGAATPYCTE